MEFCSKSYIDCCRQSSCFQISQSTTCPLPRVHFSVLDRRVCSFRSRLLRPKKKCPRRSLLTCGIGFGGFLSPESPDSYTTDSLPSPETRCACGSERPYGKCCRRFHIAQNSPRMAEELLRSRYTAYAYRLPSYIMKTTHSSLAELDRRKWKREILEFCRDYQFVGGVDIIEQQVTGPSTTRILFRANMMQRSAAISFLEMATFTRERNIWYYKSGKLVDVDDEGGFTMVRATEPHITPSLAAFSRNIELRVRAGVQGVATSLNKAEDKGAMLEHIRGLVLSATGMCFSGQRKSQLESPLVNIFLKEERHSLISGTEAQQRDKRAQTLQALFWFTSYGAGESSGSHNFVRLVKSDCCFDSSRQFVVILVQLEVLGSGETGVSVKVRSDQSVSISWELDAVEGEQEGDILWLVGRSALATVAMTGPLNDQLLTITAHTADERSQCLGTLTMSAFLQSAFDGDLVKMRDIIHSFPPFRPVHFVVEGRNAHGIQKNTGNLECVTRISTSQMCEDIAVFSISASCGTALVTSVAQARAGIDDDASIRGTMLPSPSSLRLLDDLLLLLDSETHTDREIAARQDTFGYTLPDINQILETQIASDICLGMMEESYLETWG